MHPTMTYELTKARAAELHPQARRDALARPKRHQAEPAPARLDTGDAQCRALFVSSLQPSDAPGADVVAEAISVTLHQIGTQGCTGRMAQEFGDHPEAATERMRWARTLLGFR